MFTSTNTPGLTSSQLEDLNDDYYREIGPALSDLMAGAGGPNEDIIVKIEREVANIVWARQWPLGVSTKET